MSKSGSGYYSGTSGEGRALISEVQANGDKINPDDVVGIAKDKSGKIIWLISTEDIADFVLTAVSKGKIIGYQGKGTGRPIYQVEYYGKTYKVAVTVGSNGYIVGANPR